MSPSLRKRVGEHFLIGPRRYSWKFKMVLFGYTSPFIKNCWYQVMYIAVTDSLGLMWSSAYGVTMTLFKCLMWMARMVPGCWHNSVVITADHHQSSTLLAIKCLSGLCLTILGISLVSLQLLSSRQVRF